MTTDKLRFENEAGVGIVMIFVVVALMMFVSALVIDLARLEFAGRALQRAANAAALAAAVELNMSSADDLDRWRRSKRAAIAVLKRNPIFAAGSIPDAADPSQHRGDSDSCEVSGDYRWQIYDNGQIQFTIERGDYTDSASGDFVSMEGGAVCDIGGAGRMPTAARVTLTAFNISYVFPIFAPGKNQISRVGLGVHFD